MLARAWLAAGSPEPARKALEVVLESGSDPEASWLLSRAWLQERNLDEAVAALKQADDYGDRDPTAREPAPFVGAETCRPCHKEIFQAQQASHHASTFHVDAGIGELPLPDHPLIDRDDPKVSHTFTREGEHVQFSATRDGQTVRALIDYAFGSGDRGATPVGRDESGQYRELRLSHYGDGSGWDVTTGHPPVSKGAELPAFLGEPLTADAVRRCLSCHTTDETSVQKRQGPASADRAIGCERCHGPGGNHVRAMSVAPAFPDLAIARPRVASAEQVMALCSRCHSPRGMTVQKSDPTSIRFQGTTLTWSRCYTESQGALSCVTCHDPHRDAETDHAYYVSKCLACHAENHKDKTPHHTDADADGARPIALAETVKRVPCPVEPSGHCLDCHMPTVKGIIPHTTFTDHHIRVHGD